MMLACLVLLKKAPYSTDLPRNEFGSAQLGDPERYLAEVIRIMLYWTLDRYLELAPAYWTQARARLGPLELETELGFVTVPSIFARAPEQSIPS